MGGDVEGGLEHDLALFKVGREGRWGGRGVLQGVSGVDRCAR